MLRKKDRFMNKKAQHIDKLQSFKINNSQQWVLVRGTDIKNPLVLFLHGGPGFSQIAFAPAFQKKLEEHFLVVNWDQRGAGKSFSEQEQNRILTLEDFINDMHLFINALLLEYKKDKIILIGHSWGSTLGTLYCVKYPEHISGLVCCGYGINFRDGEKVSLQYLSLKASEAKCTNFFKEMEPFKNEISKSNFTQYIAFKSKWMGKFGGYFNVPYSRLLIKALPSLLSFRYYSIKDYSNWIKGIKRGQAIGKNTLLNIDLFTQAPKVNVPLFFCIGRHDYNTPWEVARKYYKKIEAPYKEWIWFENSAHSPIFEESDMFAEIMVSDISPHLA